MGQIAKLIVHGRDRSEALTLLREALAEYQVVGPSTNIEFLKSVAGHQAFAAGPVETSFVPTHHDELFARPPVPADVLAQAALFLNAQRELTFAINGTGGPWSTLTHRRFGDVSEQAYTLDEHTVTVRHPAEDEYDVSVDGTPLGRATCTLMSQTEMVTQLPSGRSSASFIPQGNKLHVFHSGRQYTFTQPALLAADGASGSGAAAADSLTSPMPATVIEVRVQPGDEVKAGQVCAVLESMKMEINIRAGRDGRIGKVNVSKGQTVEEGAVLVALETEAAGAAP